MKRAKKREVQAGFRAIHTDYYNNGFKVTYDDQASNAVIIPKRRLTQSAFMRELALNSDIELI